MRHRIRARSAHEAPVPRVHTDPALVTPFLSDAAHVPNGWAAGVSSPANEAEAAALVAQSTRILAVGAQSSLTGGATPRGEVVLSTRAMTGIGQPRDGSVRAGAGVPISTLQQSLAASGLWYPPAPTYEGAFLGGVIATNAAGPATFKYGSTRRWVNGLTVVLASGDVLDIERGQVMASSGAHFEIERPSGARIEVPVPTYEMPAVVKLSAGYYSAPETDLIDLFIGSEGTLGVIVHATVRVIARPPRAIVLIACGGDAQAVELTATLRNEARAAWDGRGPLDVSAVEYVDARALDILRDEDFARAGMSRPPAGAAVLFVHLEIRGDEDAVLDRLNHVLSSHGILDDPRISLPGDDRSAEQLLQLREAVPAAVNGAVAASKARAHPDIEKTAGDMIAPFDRVLESLHVYRQTFEKRGLDYALWGHVSDGNLHPNVIPHSIDDVERGREALEEIAQRIVAMGGAPLAEHGVGRNALKQRLLRNLYGEEGIEQMRAVKRALDPEWRLAPGVLFAPGGS